MSSSRVETAGREKQDLGMCAIVITMKEHSCVIELVQLLHHLRQ